MKLSVFMNEAYHGKARIKKLETQKEEIVFGLEDLADRVGKRPSREEIEKYAPKESVLLNRLISHAPGKDYKLIWGYLSSIAAERTNEALLLPKRDFVGLELRSGTIILEDGGNHVGERMTGGKIIVLGNAGDYLGQGISGGRIIANSCEDYGFRNMRGGSGLIRADCGKFIGLGNSGGRIVVLGSCQDRAGWLMRGGSLRVKGDAGDYLGLLMSGGRIVVSGKTGKRAGWRMKGGSIEANNFGLEAANCVRELD